VKKSWCCIGALLGSLIFCGLEAVAPSPLQNYCPVVIVNNTTIDPSQVYLVATALDQNGIPCFLTPNTSTGICSYEYPNADCTNGSVASSVALEQLPLATGTGISGTAYLIYLPINTSARAYFSINNPMHLSTTYSASRGLLAINSPSIISLNDPNYYTLYQDFEFGLDESSTNSSTNMYINLSWVDYFCLPMKLYANSYLGQGSDPTINNSVSGISGMPSGSTQTSIMTTTMNTLNSYPTTWAYLPVSYYPNPYTSTTSSGYIRILAPKNSTDLSTGRLFSGGPVTYNYFPTNYVNNSSAGPVSGQSYMEALYNYYLPGTHSPLYAIITPTGGNLLYKVYSDSGNAGRLLFDAYEPGGSTAIPADNTYLDLYTLPLDQLFSGGIDFANGFANDTPIGAELGKLVSALFSIGQLPFTASSTSATSPFYNAGDYTIGNKHYGYINLSYFSNPPSYTGGPWYNLYDKALHLQMVGTQTLAKNPTLGMAYAYDYDDLLLMSGIINGLAIQDQYGNPSQATGAVNPYIVIELESLAGSTIPTLEDPYYYNVTIGPAANGATVVFTYNGGSTNAPVSGNATPFALHGGTPISGGSSDYLHATFTFDGIEYVFNVNLVGQIVTPIVGGTYSTEFPTFSAADVQYQGNFTFDVTGGGNGSSPGAAIEITINFNSSPPPWPG
jgi:hypothetical protein